MPAPASGFNSESATDMTYFDELKRSMEFLAADPRTVFLGQAVGALAIGYAIARLGYVQAFRLDAAGIATLTAALTVLMRRPPARIAAGR